MLLVNNISLAFGTQVIFDKVSFTVGTGERVGLVGRNGHGKTTLLNIISGKMTPDSGEVTAPRLYKIGCLEQSLRFSEGTVLAEAMTGLPAGSRHEAWQAEKILYGLGFSAEEIKFAPQLLSGGFQVRLNLAKVLLSAPNLLLLDEPTNYLDIVAMRWLVGFLRSWTGELIFITHDRTFMDSVATHILGIHRCNIRKIAGNTSKYYEKIAEAEDLYERTRVNEAKKRQEIEVFINRFRSKANLATRVQSRIKLLQKRTVLDKLSQEEELEISFTSVPFKSKNVLEVADLSFGYAEDEPLLFSDLDFTIGARDRIAVVGRNGKGKSTLLKILAGELTPRSGGIKLHQNAVCGYFGQTNIDRLESDKTVEDSLWDMNRSLGRQVIRNICGAMMFSGDLALKKTGVLSGGEKTRVLLGKLLLMPMNLLIIDEPTNHLDMDAADALLQALDSFDGAIIIVTHNEMYLHSLAERLIVFDDERAFNFNGTWQDFLDSGGFANGSIMEENSLKGGNAKERAVQQDGKALSQKEGRINRARKLQEKTAALKPLQKAVEELENAVKQNEDANEKLQAELVAASMDGDADRIKSLSCELHMNNEVLESLYEKLLDATEKYENMKEKFS